MSYTPPSERGPVTADCPACGQRGEHGEYGVSCKNDRCRVISYKQNNEYR